jgi:serine/threonine protein phosphatase PrpC
VGSDGLFKRLREDILFDVIRRKNVQSDTEAEDVLKYLIRNVMEMGEKDNISGVLVRIT